MITYEVRRVYKNWGKTGVRQKQNSESVNNFV